MSAAARAEELRRLHVAPELLVVVNVWDAVSARVAAGVPGCRALGTASWSIAAARGVGDGERLTRDAMLAAVAAVCGATELPVSADLERGYGAGPGDVAETVARAIAAGAVGCNLEDALRPVGEHVERLVAARERAAAEGVPIVINARADSFLLGTGEPEARLHDAVSRCRAYTSAGADCVFVPGLADAELIRRLVRAVDAPVSLLATPASPPLRELERLGVARVSFGPGTLGAAMAALRRAAEALVALDELPADLGFRG